MHMLPQTDSRDPLRSPKPVSGTATPEFPVQNAAPAQPLPSRWMRRVNMALFVMICIEMGAVLVILPWHHAWLENSLVIGSPWLHQLAQNYFLRGAISGIGLIDVFLGVHEALTYREDH